MAYEYSLDRSRQRLTIVRSGPTDLLQVLNGLDRQAADDAWSYGLLHDASASTTSLDLGEVKAVAEHARQLSTVHGRRGPVAFVTRASALVGAMEIYAYLSGQRSADVQIFLDRGEAERWLDTLNVRESVVHATRARAPRRSRSSRRSAAVKRKRTKRRR